MIYIVYTTKAKQQRRFDLRTGHPEFIHTISKSSIARNIEAINYGSSVSLQKYIDGGMDINFEGTTPDDKAIIKLLPYDKTTFEIATIYGDLVRLERKNPSLYTAIKTKLLVEKYNNIYELFDDIRDSYKSLAVNMISLYQPMIASRYRSYIFGGIPNEIPQKILYENIEQIEDAIRKEYGTKIYGVGYRLCSKQTDNIVVAEYHADIAKESPYVRMDLYLNKSLNIKEIVELKEALRGTSFEAYLELPEFHRVRISKTDSVLTAEEMNRKYFE